MFETLIVMAIVGWALFITGRSLWRISKGRACAGCAKARPCGGHRHGTERRVAAR